MKKLLVVINLKGSLGGAEIRYLSLFNEIAKRKNDYTLIINRRLYDIAIESYRLNKASENIIVLEIDKPISHQKLTNKGVSVTKRRIKKYAVVAKILFVKNQFLSLLQYIKYVIELNKAFKRKKPSYVYAVWIGGMISWPLKYLYKFKFVYSFMDSGFSSIYPGFIHPLKNERMPLKHADVIDFLSEDLYYGIKNRVHLSEKTKVSISECSFKDYSNLFPEYPKQNTIVFCSRMTPIKNPLLLLESIRILNDKYDNWSDYQFLFLGDGECFGQMNTFVNENKLSNVELLDNVANPVEYYRTSKIFISIQQSNNYPSQSLLEAMACENAIIASDVGETRKLVSEKEGVLVDLKGKDIAEGIIELLDNEANRMDMAKKARQKVLKEHNIDRYLNYFYSLETL